MSQNAQVVHSPKFESALVKIQEQAYDSLDVQERVSLKHLLKQIFETDSEPLKKVLLMKLSKNENWKRRRKIEMDQL